MSDADLECELKEGADQPLVKRTKSFKRGRKRRSNFKLKRKMLTCIVTWLVCTLLLLVLCFVLVRSAGWHKSGRSQDPTKTILLWNTWDGDARWGLPNDTVNGTYLRDELGCGIWQCTITTNRYYRHKELSDFDAVLVNAGHKMALKLNSSQYHVFVNKHVLKQPLYNSNHSIDFYNLTMTYTHNANVVFQNYELFINDSVATTQNNTQLEPQFVNKSSVALFIADASCRYRSYKQGLLLKEIQQHMPVDIVCELVDNTAFAKYKFLLTFEDALCVDFLSNNFYRAIQNAVVPVVLSGGNYTRYLPYGTSINGEAFPNVTALTEYLLELNNNEALYIKYLEAAHRFLLRPANSIFCRLCVFLHHGAVKAESYNVPQSWWESRYCQTETKLED